MLRKIPKFQLDYLLDLKQILQNEYLLAKIGADTAENEPTFAKI